MTEFAQIITALDEIAKMLRNEHVSPLMTSAEVADFLRCSKSQVEKLTAGGLLPYYRLDPRKPKSLRLYHRRTVISYLVSGRNPVKHRLAPAEKAIVRDLL